MIYIYVHLVGAVRSVDCAHRQCSYFLNVQLLFAIQNVLSEQRLCASPVAFSAYASFRRSLLYIYICIYIQMYPRRAH